MTVQEKFEYLEAVYRRKHSIPIGVIYFAFLIEMGAPNDSMANKLSSLYNTSKSGSLNTNTYKNIVYCNNLILAVNLLYKLVKDHESKG